MASPSNLSREYRMYLAIWRKAFQTQEEISLNAPSFAMALAIRQGMYRAIRPYRTGQQFDPELKAASETFVVSAPKGEDQSQLHKITIKPRSTLSVLEAEFASLGLDEEDLLLNEEKALNLELENLMGEAGPKPRSTPFYER